jgi:hypothetical protein
MLSFFIYGIGNVSKARKIRLSSKPDEVKLHEQDRLMRQGCLYFFVMAFIILVIFMAGLIVGK